MRGNNRKIVGREMKAIKGMGRGREKENEVKNPRKSKGKKEVP